MRPFITLLALIFSVESSFAAVGLTLEQLKLKYSAIVETNRYRPDLYPTSYIFKADDALLEVTILDGQALHIKIAFEKAPQKPNISELLLRYSGISGWLPQATTDPQFAKYFPAFSTTHPGNAFYTPTDESVFALIQRNVGSGELVIWLSSKDYPTKLKTYRKK